MAKPKNYHEHFVRQKTKGGLQKQTPREMMETLLSVNVSTTTVADDLLRNITSVDNYPNSSVTTCSPSSPDCQIDHTVTCIGEIEYCNLTKSEYEHLLFDYISPTIPEWILIFSHLIVFLMGLVSLAFLLKLLLRLSFKQITRLPRLLNKQIFDF